MKLLLDTHVVIWALVGSPRLSQRVRALLEDRRTELAVSAVTIMEIFSKHRIGKLPEGDTITRGLDGYLQRLDASVLAISEAHARLAGSILSPHRDPFDRFIAAQCIIEGIPLLSRDAAFPSLGVQPIW